MSDEDDTIDPEVAADLRLRAATARERRASHSEVAWHPPPIVGKWRCRNPKCPTMVDVPEPAMDRYCAFNAELRKRGEEPLDRDKIMFCEACREHVSSAFADRRREQVERMRSAIIELKEARDDARQREILEQLKAWHHPDIDGLTLWLRERSRSAASKRPIRDF